MQLQIDVDLRYDMPDPVDVLLTIEAAQAFDQLLLKDCLLVDGSGPLRPIEGEESLGRRTWLRAHGTFRSQYRAVVEVERQLPILAGKALTPPRELPALVIPYLWPSRYCEADKFEQFVTREFGSIDGGEKIVAMADWIFRHIEYRSDRATPRRLPLTRSSNDRAFVATSLIFLGASRGRPAYPPGSCQPMPGI